MKTNVPLLRSLMFISVFASALFTGLMACFLIVIDRMLASLDGTSYTKIMQGLIRNADIPPLVPAMVVISLVGPLVTLILMRRSTDAPSFRLTAMALIMMLIVLYITIGLNVPINNSIMQWNISSPPGNWAEIRQNWHALNLYRTPASALSFAFNVFAICFLTAESEEDPE